MTQLFFLPPTAMRGGSNEEPSNSWKFDMQGIGPVDANTLDEPVWSTLKRDLLAIAVKVR
jgi:hypothetical protein